MIYAYRLLLIVLAKSPQSLGGFGWEDPTNLGVLQGVCGICLTVYLLKLLPLLTQRLKLIGSYQLLSWIILFGLVFFSFINIVDGVLFWVLLLALASVCYCKLMGFDILASIILSNSVPKELLGDANGITQGGVVLFRSLGNLSCGALFGWSSTSGLSFPLDYRFMFYYLMALTVVGWCIVTYGFNESIEQADKTPELRKSLMAHSP